MSTNKNRNQQRQARALSKQQGISYQKALQQIRLSMPIFQPQLNEYLGQGMRAGELMNIFSRPQSGKSTWLAQQLLAHARAGGRGVLWTRQNDKAQQLLARLSNNDQQLLEKIHIFSDYNRQLFDSTYAIDWQPLAPLIKENTLLCVDDLNVALRSEQQLGLSQLRKLVRDKAYLIIATQMARQQMYGSASIAAVSDYQLRLFKSDNWRMELVKNRQGELGGVSTSYPDGEQVIDLHGHTALPFPNFSEDATYLERVTISEHDDAVKLLQEYGADWGEQPTLQRIWMRYGRAENDTQREQFLWVGDDPEQAWWECESTHQDALPFWKDSYDNPVSE